VSPYQDLQLDALGDPTRRAILAHLLNGPLSVQKIADQSSVSRPAISQHLRILKQAGLVVDHAEGNRRIYQIHPEGFETLREYFEQFWRLALEAFKRKVEEKEEEDAARS
jgi:DNA-binding transcriptional ArsR family regulator